MELDVFLLYVVDSSIRVRVDFYYSTNLEMGAGVPQGSMLGPMLFVTYTSNLLPLLKSFHTFYVKDQ